MPHPALKRVCAPVEDLGEAARIAQDLVDTMEASPRCVGIAAPQIGEEVRMAIVDVTGHKRAVSCAGRLVLVNPVVVDSAGSIVIREGCLSIPDFTGDVRRGGADVVEALGGAGGAPGGGGGGGGG